MKAAKNEHGIDHIITVTNEDNEREVEQMVGKAMCAYANFLNAKEHEEHEFKYQPKEVVVQRHLSEYEATVRCIAMFVDQPTFYICQYVIARAWEEFGV